MKTKTSKLLTAFALTLAIAAFTSFTPQNALADEENSADITKGGPCAILAVLIDGTRIFVPGGEEIITVENKNVTVLKCKGVSFNDTGKTQVFKGFPCLIGLPSGGTVLTFDTHGVVTKKGVSTMTCKFTAP